MTTTEAHVRAAQAVLRVTGPIPFTDAAIETLETLVQTAQGGSAVGMIRQFMSHGLYFECCELNGKPHVRAID